jgi:lipopolysaccharide/colanic/teichoic acid biosynthesis glycosyltransferase
MTGPWQVQGRNNLSFEEMMRLDLAYVDNMSFRTDLALLLRTVPAVVRPQQDC